MKISKHVPFKILSLTFVILFVLPTLIQDGMFIDGQQYACVAKNMAEGKGSFWFPHLSDTWLIAGSTNFMEHPPLVYAVQSIFFKCLGNSIYTERFYSLFTLIIALILIIGIWKIIFPQKSEYRQFWWVAVLFWIWIPLTSWCYQNNMMENTMVVFDLLAVLFLLKFLNNDRYKLIYFAGGSLSVLAAFLSKGIPGIFPLVFIPVYGLVFKNRSIKFYFIYSLAFIVLTFIWFFLLFQWTEAHKSLCFYLYERVFQRISESATVDSHFNILLKLFENLSPLIVIAMIAFLVKKGKQSLVQCDDCNKYFKLFILIGFSASLPIMITRVQRGFYLMPSFPFFAVAIACFCLPFIRYLMLRVSTTIRNVSLGIALMFFAFSVIYTATQIGNVNRDELMLEDVHSIGNIVPVNTIISVPDNLYYSNWSMQMYLTRHYNISFIVSEDNTEWYISENDNQNDSMILNLISEPYSLYKSPSQ
ncbi:MAG TPA: hypothetical protein PLL66_08035 [Bacteroidales bacterium]|nr:hypothetical protein [Bacteroidales bacterium]